MACPHCGARGTVRRSKTTDRRRCIACGESWLPSGAPAAELAPPVNSVFYPRQLTTTAALEAFIAHAPPPAAFAAGLLAEELWRSIDGTDLIWQPDKVAQYLMTPWESNQPQLVLACRSTLDRLGLDSDMHPQFIQAFGDIVVTAGVNTAIHATAAARSKAIKSGLLKVGAVALGALLGAWWS